MTTLIRSVLLMSISLLIGCTTTYTTSSITDSTVEADNRIVGFWHTSFSVEDETEFLFIETNEGTNKLNVLTNSVDHGDGGCGVFSGLTRHLANNLWLFEMEVPQDIYYCFRPHKSLVDQAEFAAERDRVSAKYELGILNQFYLHVYYKIVSVSELETELLGKSVTERSSVKEDIEDEANKFGLDPNQIDVLLIGTIEWDDWWDAISSGGLKAIRGQSDYLDHFVLITEPPEALKNLFAEASNKGKLEFNVIGLRRKKE